MKTEEEIFEQCFRSGMINKDFEAFKQTHPALLKCILDAMRQVSNLNKVAVNVSLPCDFAEWILKSRFIRCRDIDNYWWEKENDPTNTPYQTGDLYILFRRGNER